MVLNIKFFKGNTQGHTWVKLYVNWNYGSGDIKVQRSEGLLVPTPRPENSEKSGLGRVR